MKALFLHLLFIGCISQAWAQSVGIGTQTPNSSAMLDVSSITKGMLIPRMTEAQKNAIALPATGLLLWQTDSTPGFYFNSGTPEGPKWIMLSVVDENIWKLTGNNNVNPGSHFIGTTNQQPINFRINNVWAGQLDSGKATLFGYRAGWQNESNSNTGFGHEVLYTNSTGYQNTAVGYKSLYTNRSGYNNMAIGALALNENSTGYYNSAGGAFALKNNSTGHYNAAFGTYALENNATGDSNVAVGVGALRYGTSNSRNTAVGVNALNSPQSNDNTAVGYNALKITQFGDYNTAIGSKALEKNLNGLGNIAMGYQALGNSNYNWNTAIGYWALRNNQNGAGNTAIGSNAMDGNLDAGKSTAIGYYAELGGANRTNATANGYRSYAECNNCMNLGTVEGKNSAWSSVKVGIGTTNPFRLLSLNTQSADFSGPQIGFTIDDTEYASLSVNNLTKDVRLSTAGPSENRLYLSAGSTQLKISPLGTVTIGPSGMVGPYTFLISDSDKDPMIQFQKNATDKGFIQIVNDDIKIGTNTSNDNGNFYIRTNGSDRVIVTNNGSMGVGTASPAVKFQVGVNGDGTVARANSWTTFSDERYKSNIETIPGALDKLEGLSGYYYKWNSGADQTRQVGLIAQEVEKVLPEIVSTDNNGYKSVDYGKMNALLLQAIKEQQILIMQLQQKVESLKPSK